MTPHRRPGDPPSVASASPRSRLDTAVAPLQGGFSLVELVVVIGVMVLLVGLTLSVGMAVVTQAERRQTQDTLRLLDTAVGEWEVSTDRKLSWWDTYDDPALRDHTDVHADTPEVLIITEVLDVITRPTRVKEMVGRIDPDFVHIYRAGDYPAWIEMPREKSEHDTRFSGSLTILDAWGTPIYATHPGRAWADGDDMAPDNDGTIRTYNEELYGIAPNRQMVFVSAGPDERFGLVEEFDPGDDLTAAIEEARKDNVFSVPVTFPPAY
ncbi:MAG: type II secretion system protein [Planctomycetota bacterium]|jgi:type II secretory pathway pseudopilin PulG